MLGSKHLTINELDLEYQLNSTSLSMVHYGSYTNCLSENESCKKMGKVSNSSICFVSFPFTFAIIFATLVLDLSEVFPRQDFATLSVLFYNFGFLYAVAVAIEGVQKPETVGKQ